MVHIVTFALLTKVKSFLAISCDVPNAPTNGVLQKCSNGYWFGSACTFVCGYEYTLIGNDTITCTQDSESRLGIWNLPAPSCQSK